MSAPPLVSCVIPVRDGERYLGAAIDSVLAQDHPRVEVVVVVDTATTDGSSAVARAFGGRVRVIEDPSGTAPGGRNAGVAAARGDLVGFLDADDLYRPGKVSLQVARFAARAELDVSLCAFESFWEPGLEEEEARYRSSGKVGGTHVFDTLLARRAVFDRVGPMDPSLPTADQADWFERLAACDDLVVEVLPEVGVSRRMHAASLSHQVTDHGPWLDLLKRRLDARRPRPAG